VTWLLRNWEQVAIALYEHVLIALTALAIAAAISLVLGVWAARRPRAFAATLAVTGALYTIPTLAFLALLIPLVGLGKINVVIAMVAFSLVIMTRNVATGIRDAPADIVEAAKGMGMSAWQVLVRVEFPLALPVIVAGLRIATVTVISVTTVGAYVNAGGLGTLIFNGIATDHAPKIWTGALAACALAVVADLAMTRLEQALRRRRKA
jgi:osmoprotectant transport system permease protein